MYAGHFVPQLSQLVHTNNIGVEKPVINFKGFMVLMDTCAEKLNSHKKLFHQNLNQINKSINKRTFNLNNSRSGTV
jgi:hypothetical protein